MCRFLARECRSSRARAIDAGAAIDAMSALRDGRVVSWCPTLVLSAALPLLSLAGCSDFTQAMAVQDSVRERVGWQQTKVRIDPVRSRMEIEVRDPGSGAADSDRETAATVARLARELHDRARDADSLVVSFHGISDARGRDVTRWYQFPADSL